MDLNLPASSADYSAGGVSSTPAAATTPATAAPF